MRANRAPSVTEILRHEGGYVDHPRDPGGCTNLGVTIATFRAHVNPRGTCADLRRLTKDQATTVYVNEYWDAVQGDHLPAGVDLSVFDMAVNAGPSRAARLLQRLVGAAQDGKIGPLTREKVWDQDPGSLVDKYAEARLAYYTSLRTFPTFGKGWTRRTRETQALAKRWVAVPPTEPVAAPTGVEALQAGLRSHWQRSGLLDLRKGPAEASAKQLQALLGVPQDAHYGNATWDALAAHVAKSLEQ